MKRITAILLIFLILFTGCSAGGYTVKTESKPLSPDELALPDYFFANSRKVWALSFDGETVVFDLKESEIRFGTEESTLVAYNVEKQEVIDEIFHKTDGYITQAYYKDNKFVYIKEDDKSVLCRADRKGETELYTTDNLLTMQTDGENLFLIENEDFCINQISKISEDLLVPVFENKDKSPEWQAFICPDDVIYFEEYIADKGYSLYIFENGRLEKVTDSLLQTGTSYGVMAGGMLEYVREEKPYVRFVDFASGATVKVFDGEIWGMKTDGKNNAMIICEDGFYYLEKDGTNFTVRKIQRLYDMQQSCIMADGKTLFTYDNYYSPAHEKKTVAIGILD